MRAHLTRHALLALLALPLLASCDAMDPAEADPELAGIKDEDDTKADASAVAVFLNFEFDAELLTDHAWDQKGTIQDQLLYTMGQLNGETGVARLDKVELSNLVSKVEGTKTRLSYHAKLPVAWGKKSQVPTSYTFRLPRDISYAGQSAFTEKYKGSCVEWGAHDVDSGSMWYYFRPAQSGCKLDAADILGATATVTPSTTTTTGKFPEYNKVWEDGVLRVVAIFGKYEDGKTEGDAGISGYNSFVSLVKSRLASAQLVTTPADVPANPGVKVPDITLAGTLPSGKKVEVVALLVDNVQSGGAAFNARYTELSTRADVITYNGHAGLGSNVRFLARMGKWVAGQYVIVFMNGCDTFAYVDDALNNAHKTVNPDDTTGTKYIDILTNAMPSYFSNMPSSTMALVDGLLAFDAPKTYEQIFANISSSQVVLVTGEQDNTYVPGGGGGGGTTGWQGMTAQGSLKKGNIKRFATPKLAKGEYVFTLSGTGDADLYVRIGTQPSTSLYDCRPYLKGAAETCKVSLPADAVINVMVRGFNASTFQLAGAVQQ